MICRIFFIWWSFLWWFVLSISYPKNVWQSQCQRAFPIYIHLRVLLFWVLYLFSSWFLSGVRLGSNLILFMWLFSSPKNLFWRTFPFPLSICDTLVEHQSTVMHWFISGFNILFLFFFFFLVYLSLYQYCAACAKSLQVYLTLCDSMDCSLPGSSLCGILQQEYWRGLPIPSPGDLPNPGNPYLFVSCVGKQILYHQCHTDLITVAL